MVEQEKRVVRSLAEGRQLDGHDLQPVVEVLAEAAPLDLVVKVLVRGADEADVHNPRARLADAADLFLLEDAEELGLEGQRQISDLVEKERAAGGLFDKADLVPHRPGERAPGVAEELAFEERLRDGGAIDGDERPAASAARVMNGLRRELFARAALAGDEDRSVRIADLLDHGADAPDRRRLAEEGSEGGSVLRPRRGFGRASAPVLFEEIDDGRHGQGQELEVVRVERPVAPVPGQKNDAGRAATQRPGIGQQTAGAMPVPVDLEVGEERLLPEVPDKDRAADLEGPADEGFAGFFGRGLRSRLRPNSPRGLENRIALDVEGAKDGLVRGDVVEDDLGGPGKQLMVHRLFPTGPFLSPSFHITDARGGPFFSLRPPGGIP